ncbi:MAG: hypothetical protein ABH843_00745 [Candidatus Omnitrophota bacterium]
MARIFASARVFGRISVRNRLIRAIKGKRAGKSTSGAFDSLRKGPSKLPESTLKTIEAVEKAKGNLRVAASIIQITPGGFAKRIETIRAAEPNLKDRKSKALVARLNNALKGEWAGKWLHGKLPGEAAPSMNLSTLNRIDAAA